MTQEFTPFPSQRLEEVIEWITGLEDDARLMVILSASRMEELLKSALSKVFIHEAGTDDSLLGSDKPLSSFSSKILICYRLGLIDRELERFLQQVRKFRNTAAHSANPINIDSSPHIDHIKNMFTFASTSPMFQFWARLQDLTQLRDPADLLRVSLVLGVLCLEVLVVSARPIQVSRSCGFSSLVIHDSD